MVTVHVEPSGLEVEVAEGQSIMAAAECQGLRWPTVCHGQAQCHACYFQVTHGQQHLEPPGPLEAEALVAFAGRAWYEDRVVRLACQARVRGDMTVHKPGVRAAS